MNAAEKIIDLAERRASLSLVQGAQPMAEEGFICVPNSVEDALLRSPVTQRQERVYRAILRKTLGYQKTSDSIATSQIAEITGIEEANCRKALSSLEDMGMIVRGKRSKYGTIIQPVLNPEFWEFGAGKVKSTRTGQIDPNSDPNGSNRPEQTGQIDPHKRQLQNTTTTPVVPKASKAGNRKPAVTLKTWLEACKASGESVIPEDDPVFDDTDKTGLPIDFVRICWLEFRDTYRDGAKQTKRYADWRATFRNAVRGNWYKLWALNSQGEYFLTTQGQMAMRRFNGGEA